MPPVPKNPATRQRRNRPTTAARLGPDTAAARRGRKVPKLPELTDEEGCPRSWHPMTAAYWDDLWRSPMSSEYVQADVHRLFMLAVLVDDFWRKPSAERHSEIRLAGQAFGLTPIDRRRLQWEVERGEEATERTTRRRTTASSSTSAGAKGSRKTKAADVRSLHLVV